MPKAHFRRRGGGTAEDESVGEGQSGIAVVGAGHSSAVPFVVVAWAPPGVRAAKVDRSGEEIR